MTFQAYLEEWLKERPDWGWRRVIDSAGGADRVGIFLVDMLNGFCTVGPLASPRVNALARPMAETVRAGMEAGIEKVVVLADTHPADAVEFEAFPPHCVEGTEEAELVPELAELPGSDRWHRVRKNSLNARFAPDWPQELVRHLRAAVLLGDCTDLCVHQLAMTLKLEANQENRHLEVIVPAGLVDTYDLPVEAARQAGALPHDAELFHRVFLYHMALNGIQVVGEWRAEL